MARPSDLVVAEIALRAHRATEEDIADCFAHQAEQARAGKTLSLGQLLIKRHKLGAEEFLEVTRKLEEALVACLECEARSSAKELEGAPEGKCPKCGEDLDVAAAVKGLPDDALRLAKAGPITTVETKRATSERRAAVVSATGSTPELTAIPVEVAKAARTTKGAILAGGDRAQGRRFGKYEILATIGIGGMGVVYKARQIDLDRVVALKVLREGEGARDEQVERFRREAQAAAKLQHPNIVAIHEVGLEEGIHYFTMDFVEGETLHDILRRGELRAPREAAKLISTIAGAVDYAHRHGIVHRDLKPGNVIITPDGTPKITDFGLAKTMAADSGFDLTRSGVAIGTPLYMSPEQVKGDLRAIDARSDVFSLGTLLYQNLTGKLPFMGESHVDLYNRILYEDPEPPRRLVPAIPKDVQTVCLKALEKRPRDRYQSAGDLARDLERASRGEPILARPPGRLERVWRAASRHRTIVLVAATALLVAGPGWYLTLAMLARQQAEVEAAARARSRAEAQGLLAEVAAAVRDGRPKDALARAAVLHARFPESDAAGEARLLEGAASLALGRTRDALGAYARAYRRAGDDAERVRAMSAMADAFVVAKDHDRALACLAKLLERYPGSSEAARAELRTGKLLAELDDAVGARAHVKKAIEIADSGAGTGTGAQSATATALSVEERREAEATLKWIDDLHPAVEIGGAEAGTTGVLNGHNVLLLVRQGVLVALAPGPEGLEEVAHFPVAGPRDAILDLAAGDLDGDVASEAIVAYRDPDDGPSLKVCKYRAGATPADPAGFAVLWKTRLEGRIARGGIAVGDVDGDGRGDIVIASAAGPSGLGGGVRVLRSTQEGG
ncbi:MAG TPA: protein kinase, partial [Planctomycetota bacterium]|nr:protein kinase [Planctomycetota bacterium]